MPGCGGDTVAVKQTFFVTEPRLLNPESGRTSSFFSKVVSAMGDVEVTCVVLSQLLSASATRSRRHLTSHQYTLDVEYEVTSAEEGAEKV